MKKIRIKKIVSVCLTAMMIATGIVGCTSKNNKNSTDSLLVNEVSELNDVPFEVTVMNVGKADCILIEIGDKSIMIDTGLNKSGKEIYARLNEKGIDTLEYLILTHMDKDHIGGSDTILENIKVNNLIQADYVKESKQYDQYIEAVNKTKIEPVKLHETISTEINGAQINIYPAEKNEYEQSNDYSIIVEITYGSYSYLFAGDAEEERLAEFLNSNDKQYTFLKVPHHGRYNSLSEKFIKSVSPYYSVITCSEEEMPDDELLNILEKNKSKTYLTVNGDVVLKSDGEKINVSQVLE